MISRKKAKWHSLWLNSLTKHTQPLHLLLQNDRSTCPQLVPRVVDPALLPWRLLSSILCDFGVICKVHIRHRNPSAYGEGQAWPALPGRRSPGPCSSAFAPFSSIPSRFTHLPCMLHLPMHRYDTDSHVFALFPTAKPSPFAPPTLHPPRPTVSNCLNVFIFTSDCIRSYIYMYLNHRDQLHQLSCKIGEVMTSHVCVQGCSHLPLFVGKFSQTHDLLRIFYSILFIYVLHCLCNIFNQLLLNFHLALTLFHSKNHVKIPLFPSHITTFFTVTPLLFVTA